MKKIVAFVFVLGVLASIAEAQDVIVLKNTDEIRAKILEIAPATVKYVEWEFQDGPVRVVEKRDIFVIKYQNGKKERFSEAAMSVTTGKGVYINRIKPEAHVYFGTSFNENGAGPTFDAAVGTRFYDYFFVGIEAAYTCFYIKYPWYGVNGRGSDEWLAHAHSFSIGANMKVYVPVQKTLFPFFTLSMGANMVPLDKKIHIDKHTDLLGKDVDCERLSDFWFQVGTGLDWRHFSISVGYQFVSENVLNENYGYIKVGVRF